MRLCYSRAMKTLPAVLALALLTIPAAAKGLDGNRLHEMCADPDLRLNAVFYTAGMAQGAALAGQKFFCIPTGVTMQQLGDVACKFVAENPDVRKESAGTVVARSFGQAWPCQKH